MPRRRQDERARARVRARLRGLPAAQAVFDVCVDGLAALRPLAVVALGSLARGRRRPDRWSDLDLGVVLPDRRRLKAVRRKVPEVAAAAGELLASVHGPGPDQWIGLIDRDGVVVGVDVHVGTKAQLRDAPPFVVIHGPARRLPGGRRSIRRGDVHRGAERAAVLAFAAWARAARGDVLEGAAWLDAARLALVPGLRRAAGASAGGLRGLERALPDALRRRVRATWPRRLVSSDLRQAIRALARLAIACGLAPAAFEALLRAGDPRGRGTRGGSR